MISRQLWGVPADRVLAQIDQSLNTSSKISFEFIEQGVFVPVITVQRELTPAQEILLDLILTEYLF